MEYKVWLQGEDGKNYVITYEGLADKLVGYIRGKIQWNPVTETLREDVNELNEIIRKEILVPLMKWRIREYLKANPNVNSRIFNNQIDGLNGQERVAWWTAKDELEKQGVIVSIKQGRGKPRLWKWKETEK